MVENSILAVFGWFCPNTSRTAKDAVNLFAAHETRITAIETALKQAGEMAQVQAQAAQEAARSSDFTDRAYMAVAARKSKAEQAQAAHDEAIRLMPAVLSAPDKMAVIKPWILKHAPVIDITVRRLQREYGIAEKLGMSEASLMSTVMKIAGGAIGETTEGGEGAPEPTTSDDILASARAKGLIK